jgi:CRISPR-associated protein Cas1
LISIPFLIEGHSLVLPQAFIAAMRGEDEQEFRQRCISGFQRAEALDLMIDGIKETATLCSKVSR